MMLTRHVDSFSAAIFVLALIGVASAQEAPPAGAQRFTDATTKLIAAVNADDQPAIQQMFNEAMQQALPPEQTGPFFRGVLSAKGKLQAAGAPEVSGPAAKVRVTAERGNWQFEITLDASDKIAGLRVLPGDDNLGRKEEPTPETTQASDQETTYFELRRSNDRPTKIIADRYFNLVKLQEWSDLSGKSKVTAKYVDHDPDLKWVKLQAVRGRGADRVVKEITVPVEKLSKTCQSRVRQINALQKKLDELAAAANEEDAAAAGDPGAPMVDERGVEPEFAGRRGERFAEPIETEVPPPSSPPVEPNAAPAEFEVDPLGFAEVDLSSPPPFVGPEGAAIPGVPQSPAVPFPASGNTGAAGFRHPTTAEELKDAFTNAFNAGDKETLVKIIYWGDSDPAQNKRTQTDLIDIAGIVRLIRVDLKARPDNAPIRDYTINSGTLLEIEYEGERSNVTISWPVGEIEGKYYLGAWSAEER
jgi:hypothetical protein